MEHLNSAAKCYLFVAPAACFFFFNFFHKKKKNTLFFNARANKKIVFCDVFWILKGR